MRRTEKLADQRGKRANFVVDAVPNWTANVSPTS